MPFPLDPNSPQNREFNEAVSKEALSGVSARIRDRVSAQRQERQRTELVTSEGAAQLRSMWLTGEDQTPLPGWPR
jgi:hypothetical protein